MNVRRSTSIDSIFLKSQERFKITTLNSIMSIFQVFKTHFTFFKFEFLDIVSINEDFKFVHLKTRKKYFVKVKCEHCHLHVDIEQHSSIMQYEARKLNYQNYKFRSIFNLEIQ